MKRAVLEAGSTSPWIALALAIAFYLLLAVAVFSKQPHGRERSEPTPYSRTVNVTLDTVMWVHEQHKGKLTWEQLNAEVCRHMRTRRTEPWQR